MTEEIIVQGQLQSASQPAREGFCFLQKECFGTQVYLTGALKLPHLHAMEYGGAQHGKKGEMRGRASV